MRRAAARAIALAALALASPAAAAPEAPSEIAIEAAAMFGGSSNVVWGWNEIVVRVQNNGSRPARGQVEITAESFSHDTRAFVASAPFAAGAGAGVHVRVPIRIGQYGSINVLVAGEDNKPLGRASLSASPPSGVVLFDVSEAPRLGAAIGGVAVSPSYARFGGSSGSGPTINVTSPRFDPTTGDPLLPDRAAAYQAADAVVMRSDVLARLGGAELDALAGYVLAGGTVAIAIARPEDLRHPTISALAGGPVEKQGASAVTLKPFYLPPPASSSAKTIPPAGAPGKDIIETVGGYRGGNLRPSLYGASATYGLGEVHLLAFDPTRKPDVDDPWVQARMVDLGRRAFDRRSTQAIRPGAMNNTGVNRVRKELDPNESSRWAIGAATILLCAYAVIAGPLNFGLAARRGRPLRALRLLPVFAAIAFACVVGIGTVAKGVYGRARHLTLVEAGGGMSKGSARRFRGFFASRSRELTVRTTDASSVVSTAVLAESADRRDHLVVDRDGARLVEVAALPWQTVVVREDGFGSLGDGITLAREGEGDVTVVNRSGHDLRAAVVRAPAGGVFYFPRIKDGDKVTTSGATTIGMLVGGHVWESRMKSTYRAGTLELHRLHGFDLAPLIQGDAPGLADAWGALEEATGDGVDWLPDGAPTLIGQLDGGEGRTSDSGLRIERDRLLVRVVGFGGKP